MSLQRVLKLHLARTSTVFTTFGCIHKAKSKRQCIVYDLSVVKYHTALSGVM